MKFDNPIFFLLAGSTLVGIGIWIGRTEFLNKAVRDALKEIKQTLAGLKKNTDKILDKIKSGTIEGESPYRLNDKGLSVSNSIDAKQWAKRKSQELVPSIKGKQPFEIYEFCKNFVRYEFNPNDAFVQKMKMCAYENAITVSEVEDVLIIELRDAIINILPD